MGCGNVVLLLKRNQATRRVECMRPVRSVRLNDEDLVSRSGGTSAKSRIGLRDS